MMHQLEFEFIGRVVIAAQTRDMPSESIGIVTDVARREWNRGLIYRSQQGTMIPQILDTAEELFNQERSRPVSVPDSPEKELIEIELFQEIRPQLIELRDELSQLASLPFHSREQAAKWIKEIVQKQPKPSKEDKTKVDCFFDEVEKKCREAELLLHRCRGDIALQLRTTSALPFLNEKSEPDVVILSRESRLLPLARVTHELAEATGFSQGKLIMWVLTGEKAARPVLPTFVVDPRVRIGLEGTRLYAMVLFNAYPTLKDLRLVRKELSRVKEPFQLPRKVRSGRRPKISGRDWELVQTIGRLYGRDPLGAKEWKDVLGEWASPDGTNEWKTVRRYWHRLKKKANRLGRNLPVVLRDIYNEQKRGRRK